MTSKKYISVGKTTALISFLIGILIFGTYFFTSNGDLLFIGYGFIVFAGIINLIILIAIFVKSQYDKANRKGLLKTGGLMLLNIPVMFACIWISMIILGNMRITFTNGTQNKLTDIKIVGCETKHIKELEPNKSKMVWVGITGDCSITVKYLENGQQKSETVAGYVTGGMGQKMKHKIDGRDKDILWKSQQLTMAIANRAISAIPIGLGLFMNTAKSFDLATQIKDSHKMQKLWLVLGGKAVACHLPYLP